MKRSRFVRGEGDKSLSEPLLAPLFEDLVECEELLKRSDSQFARRTFVRAAFAYNEGYLYWLRERVRGWLLSTGSRKNKIETNKIVLLFDDTCRPDAQGKIKAEPIRLPFLNDCAFELRTAAECWDLDPKLFFSDNGWREMQTGLRIRHRITHPKKPKDLEVADTELRSISEGHRWLHNRVVDIVNAMTRNIEKTTGD